MVVAAAPLQLQRAWKTSATASESATGKLLKNFYGAVVVVDAVTRMFTGLRGRNGVYLREQL